MLTSTCLPTHESTGLGFYPESCELAPTHLLFTKGKSHDHPSCETEYTFILYTAQSGTHRKMFCITHMIKILLFPLGVSLKTWQII
jgi:hypothetical protein